VFPQTILKGVEPRLIDEWRDVPGIWDAVRFVVDRGQGKGRFLLTGSSTPVEKAPAHSGAGRFARLQMRPMTLFESGESTGEVSLGSLLKGELFEPTFRELDLESLAYACARGGWPESIGLPESVSLRLPGQYLELLYVSDISGLGNKQRNPHKMMALVCALARNNATLVSNKSLKWDITEGTGSVSAPTVASYLAELRRVYVLEEIPGWSPDIRAKVRTRTSPKRYLVDPSLTMAALGASPERLMVDRATYGSVFEGLCLRDLRVYAAQSGARLFHYRDNSDLEIDAIIEEPSGSYGAFEVKLSGGIEDGIAALKRFERKMLRQGTQRPTVRAVITATGPAYLRKR
jgi:predicted AAA+ superfamily ATPase